jgi:hypothetical protein
MPVEIEHPHDRVTSTKHSFVRVMATKQFRRSSSISALALPFFTNFY